MKVVIAGESPLVEELAARCVTAGHETSLYLVETLEEAQAIERLRSEALTAEVVIECHNQSRQAKRRLLEHIALTPGPSPERRAPGSGEGGSLILVCAQACSTTEAASWLPYPELASGWSAIPPLDGPATVEVARALQTSEETHLHAMEFWRGLGLEVEPVADGPGLVRARVLCCLINEAASALMDGVASAEDIDTAMRLGTNYPRGPLAWGDLIGLDVVLGVMLGLYEEYRDDRYRPTALLVRYVQAGWLGNKAGRGFLEYQG